MKSVLPAWEHLAFTTRAVKSIWDALGESQIQSVKERAVRATWDGAKYTLKEPRQQTDLKGKRHVAAHTVFLAHRGE